MNKVTIKEEGVNVYNLIAPNGKCFGDIVRQDDGFFNYEGVESWVLREIADRLDEVNKPLNNSINEYFKKEQDKAEKEYKELIKSGHFWNFYPTLTGDWSRDKEEWFKIYSKLEDLRASFLKDK